MTRLHAVAAAGVFVLALAIYWATLAPGVGLVDSGALTVAAWSSGNAHPPGFPFYLMLTKVVMMLPVGSVAWRANIGSALCAALTCAMVALAAGEALLACQTTRRITALGMILAGALLASGRTLWAYATVAEVYALNSCLLGAVVWLTLRWRRTHSRPTACAAAVLFGLALGVHHVSAGLVAIAIVLCIRSRSLWRPALLAVLIAVVAYMYLPLTAARNPLWNWGDPSSPSRFLRHVTAQQYRSYVRTDTGGAQLAIVARLLAGEMTPVALLLAAGGLLAAFRRDRALFWLLASSIAACAIWSLLYPIANDQDAYLLPAFAAMAIAGAYGVAAAACGRTAVMAAFLLLPVLLTVMHWPYRDRSEWRIAQSLVENTFSGVERDGLLFTNDWQLYSPLLYFQEVERVRTDVTTIHTGLLVRAWYLEQLERRHPELLQRVSKETSAIRPLLLLAETDRKTWATPVVQQQFNRRFDDLLLGLIAAETARGRHVYATTDVAYSITAVDQPFVQRLLDRYDVAPRSIALEILPGHRPRATRIVPLELRELTDPSTRYADDDVVIREVFPSMRNLLLVRARSLARQRDFTAAAAAYRQALELDRDDRQLLRELQQVEMQR